MHGIGDNMTPGYEAMTPANQGMPNAFDGAGTGGMTSGAMSKLYAEQQPERATYQAVQNEQLNMRDAQTYAVNESLAGSKQMQLEESDKQNKIQVGLAQVLSDVVENRVPTGGENLRKFGAMMDDPTQVAAIARGRAQGTGNFA